MIYSISVNVWTDSEQSVEVQKMYEAEIPILDEIPAEKRNLRVLVMISLIRRLVDETNKRQVRSVHEAVSVHPHVTLRIHAQQHMQIQCLSETKYVTGKTSVAVSTTAYQQCTDLYEKSV